MSYTRKTRLKAEGREVESKMMVVHADNEPMAGIKHPGPHQIYRNSRVSIQKRTLTELHANYIRVEMIYGGVCGTDVHLLSNHPETGYIMCSAPSEIPPAGRVIGHEGVGRVLAAGENVHHLKPGDYITMESILVCNYCLPCKMGKFNQCINCTLLGLEKDGIFGSVVDIPGMIAHDITAYVKGDNDLQALACVEPAGVAYVACENAKVKPGNVVLIFGAGPIGILAAMLSKEIFGASEVHIVEPVPFRRKFAEKWADYTYDVDEFFTKSTKKVDVVLEASGALDNINRVFRNINPNGRVALLARSGKTFTFDHVDHMITNEIKIIGSRGHLGGAFQSIFHLYKRKKIFLREIVTKITTGPEELCTLLSEKEQIINEQCKVLVKLNN